MFNDVLTEPKENNPKCALCSCQINIADFYDGTTEIPICNYCKSTGIFTLDFHENPYRKNVETKPVIAPLSVSALRRLTGSKVCQGQKSTCTSDCTKEPTLIKLIKAPIDRTHQYKSPLNYLGYYSGRQRNRLPSLVRNIPNSATFSEETKDVSTAHEVQTPKRIGFEKIAIPVSLKDKAYLKEKGIYCSNVFLSKGKTRKKNAKLSELLPMVHFPVSWEKEETVAAEDDKDTPENLTKISTPEKIKEFKSQARKK